MTSYNIWGPSYIQLPHHYSGIGAFEYNHPEKYTDNSKYDVLTGSISNIYTSSLAEGLSDKEAIVSSINTKERHFKVDSKTLAQRSRIGLDPAQ